MGGYAPAFADDEEEIGRKLYGIPTLRDYPPAEAPSAPRASEFSPISETAGIRMPNEAARGLEATSAPTSPAPRPAQQRLNALVAQGAPPVEPLHGAKRVLDVLGQMYAPRLEKALRYPKQQAYASNLAEATAEEKAEEQANPQPKPKEEKWTGVTGPNNSPVLNEQGSPLEREENSGQYRWGNVAGLKVTPKEEAPHTVETAEGVMQYNPQSGRYDIRVGGAKEKADTATQNKENFQNGLGVLRQEGLIGPGDVTNATKIQRAIDRSKQLTDKQKNDMVGYLGANPTPGTNIQVHVGEAAGAQNVKQRGEYYAVNGRIVRGDRLSEEERANALPVKNPETAEASIRTTNSTLDSFERYRSDINKAKLTNDDVRALQVLTATAPIAHSFFEKAAAGTIDAIFGEPLTGYSEKAMGGIMTKDQYDKLSPDAQRLLVGYYNSLIANFADMKARLGSIGRNESMIQAEMHTIPLPYIDKRAANEALGRKIPDVESRNIYFGGRAQGQPQGETPPPGAKVRDYTDLH